MFKKLLLVGSASANQMMILNAEQHQALLNLQAQLPQTGLSMRADVIHSLPQTGTEITPYEPPVYTGGRPVEMYKKALSWADHVVEQTNELDRIIRIADNFITQNTSTFAEFGENSLAVAFSKMSQITVDTKNTLRDVQAYARQIKDRLGDSAEYLEMIEIPEGQAPTADDMEIMDMVLSSIRDALAYTADTTQQIRKDFAQVNTDINAFGAHLKQMIATTAMNLSSPQALLEETITAGEAQIAKLTAPTEDGQSQKDCGVGLIQKKLGKKSECDKIKDSLVEYRERLSRFKKIEGEFQATYPQLQQMAGLDKFMAQEDTFIFETEILAFLERNTAGNSILHTLEKPDNLANDLNTIIGRATAIQKASIESGERLNKMFNQTVGRHRFAKAMTIPTTSV